MIGEKPSIAVRLLQWLADAIFEHRAWFFWPQVVLFVICVAGTVRFLKANMDRNDLVGSDKAYHRNFLKFKAEFPTQDDLVCVVESEDFEKNRQFVERLGSRLEAHSTAKSPTNLLMDVFYKGDLKMLGPKALLFVPEESLVEMRKALKDYRPFIEQFSGASNLPALFQKINHQIRTAKRETNAENESLIKALPALERIIRRAEDCLGRAGIPPSPGVDALFGAGPEAERETYITFANGKIYLVTAKARNADLNTDAVDLFRRLVAETQREVSGVNVAITGEPVLEYDEMVQSQKDSTIATIVSLVIVVLIFVFAYAQTGRPLKATACLVVGLGYTMGYTTLVVGHLNILTITFVPMLIGLAIDFGVHLITRFEEELRNGRTEREAMEKAVVNTGQGIFTGCFTTAGAFFAMALTDFKGIQEMGIITGGGMLICLVPMMTMLPVLLLRRNRQNAIDHQSYVHEVERRRVERRRVRSHHHDAANLANGAAVEEVDPRARLERLWLDRPWTVVFATLTLCGISIWKFGTVYFDYNLLNMQSAGLPAVVFEKKLIDSADKSVLFGAVIADSTEQAVQLEERLKKLPSVASLDSMSKYLQPSPPSKLQLIADVKREASRIHFVDPDSNPVSIETLSQTLWSLNGYLLHISEEVSRAGETNVLESVTSLRNAGQSLRYRMFQGDREANAQKLGHYQVALLRDIQTTFETLRKQDSSGSMRVEDLPEALRHRFIGVTGKHLIQVYPVKNVWERANQEVFVRELRTVDPNVTGTPVQLLEYTDLLRKSYVEAAWWALAAIAVLVLIHFRSLVQLILALVPVLIGTIWMVGFMGWSGIPFNPANIMTLPLVIGIGVTNGIHILNRFAEEKNPSILAKSTGKAVLVSGLTTIAGFGSLVIAEHQGIQSLGWVMATGTATCMFAGLTFLPALLTLMGRARERRQATSTPAPRS